MNVCVFGRDTAEAPTAPILQQNCGPQTCSAKPYIFPSRTLPLCQCCQQQPSDAHECCPRNTFEEYFLSLCSKVSLKDAGSVFGKLLNSFWIVWECLSVTAFYAARLFQEEEWLSCQTCVVWLKSELWKRVATPLLCFYNFKRGPLILMCDPVWLGLSRIFFHMRVLLWRRSTLHSSWNHIRENWPSFWSETFSTRKEQGSTHKTRNESMSFHPGIRQRHRYSSTSETPTLETMLGVRLRPCGQRHATSIPSHVVLEAILLTVEWFNLLDWFEGLRSRCYPSPHSTVAPCCSTRCSIWQSGIFTSALVHIELDKYVPIVQFKKLLATQCNFNFFACLTLWLGTVVFGLRP